MISHTFVGVWDFDRAFRFYQNLLAELGLALKFCDTDKPWAAWMTPGADRPLFIIGRPFDGHAASPGNGAMIALLAPTRAAVDAAHSVALASGGSDEGAPGLRPRYHANYYGGYFRDPDGNKLCVVCHDLQ